jgi:hypothetical protein
MDIWDSKRYSDKLWCAPFRPHHFNVRRPDRSAGVARGASPAVSPAERHRMIGQAAYFRAERRQYAKGTAVQDWLDAEAEVDALIARRFTR